MMYSTNPWHILILIGGIQGFVLTVVLLIRSGSKNPVPYRLLSILILSVSMDMVVTYMNLSGLLEHYPPLLFISDPLYTLSGCLLYLFVQALLSEKFVFKPMYLLFFIPFGIETVFFIASAGIPHENVQIIHSLTTGGPHATDFAIFWALELTYNAGMTIAAAAVLQRYARNLKDYVTDVGKFSLRGLRIFLRLALLFFMLQGIFLLLFTAGISSIATAFTILYSLMAVTFYMISYWTLSDPPVFIRATIEQSSRTTRKNTGKYRKNPLDNKKAEAIAVELMKFMEEEKLYLTNGIKLEHIAQRLSTSTNTVSQVLNQDLKVNFYDFINQYRVEEAKRLMHDPAQRKLTLFAVALNAGFSSKSTFNKVFKENTGTTPSQYFRTITPFRD